MTRKQPHILVPIASVKRGADIGSKAHSIRLLDQHGFSIPLSFLIPENWYKLYLRETDRILEELEHEFRSFSPAGQKYAVRSSASIEDGLNHSYAGQFETVLNVSEPSALVSSVEKVWKSAEHVKDSEYEKHSEEHFHSFHMSVIVQEMVRAQWSGVCFSINPVNGRNELIIEGVEGTGDALVQHGSEPSRWVYAQGSFVDRPEEPSLGQEVLDELVDSVRKLRKICGKEVDVEWAFDGKKLYYLQCRAITTRKFPVIYSNRLSREFLPGMIKPLVWSINIPVVNSAWIRLLESMLGPKDITPEQLSHSFYYRAYFNMGTMGELFRELGFPRDSLERLLGREDPSGKSAFRPGLRTMKYVPRMLWFFISNLRLGKKFRRWVKRAERSDDTLRKELKEGFRMEDYPLLLDKVMQHAKDAAYYNIVVPLAMHLSNSLLKRKLQRKGISLESLDFFGDFPALKEYDPQYEMQSLHQLWNMIPTALRDGIETYADLQGQKTQGEVEVFCREFKRFLDAFGHFSESGNDLSYPHWNEDPDFVLNLIKGAEIQKESKEGKQFGGIAYRRAGRFRVYREMISSVYTREYGLFRILFQQTGAGLVEWGFMDQQDDVFYLTLEEHNELLNERQDFPDKSARELIAERKQEMKEQENLSLPSIIYGEVPPPLATKDEEFFQGIPTSPGQFEGKIVVVKGYEDFEKDVADKILVIPFADVGWTPLLVKAGAIVSESGGMLSHAAIVARELSIPSISSVDHACQLKDGTRAKIDGANGSLILKS